MKLWSMLSNPVMKLDVNNFLASRLLKADGLTLANSWRHLKESEMMCLDCYASSRESVCLARRDSSISTV